MIDWYDGGPILYAESFAVRRHLKSLTFRLSSALSKHSIRSRTGIFRRQTYLLYKFQNRFALSFVLLSTFDTAMSAVILYQLLGGRENPDDPSTAVASNFALDARTLWLGATLVSLLVCSFALLYVVTIVATHRVAGPIKVMHRYISELARGQYPLMRPLREHDELQDFFAELRSLVDRLHEKDVEEAKILREAIETLAPTVSAPKAQEALNALRALCDSKRNAAAASTHVAEIRDARAQVEATPLRVASQ